MVGYPESLTDPSYEGQILVLTNPIIGNYGVPGLERDENKLLKHFESDKIHIRGLVISDYSHNYNHWNAKKSLSDWLIEEKITGIFGIDTRALTKKIREKGVMLGKIVIDKDTQIEDPNKLNLVSIVSRKNVIRLGTGTLKILVIDCGIKNNIIRMFLKKDVSLIIVPWNYEIFKEEFDAIFISNGPGDPVRCVETIQNIKLAIQKEIPVFGICLGHQILALAAGAKTYKLKYGHRSQNQPCIDTETNRCYITPQNHGYAVDEKTLPKNWKVWFYNANDSTNEGIKHNIKPFMSVQFHPEGKCGPQDTDFLFDKFIEMINKSKEK